MVLNEDADPMIDGATAADPIAEKAGESGICAGSSSWTGGEATTGVGIWTMALPVREKTVRNELSVWFMLSSTKVVCPTIAVELPPTSPSREVLLSQLLLRLLRVRETS